MQTVIKIFVVIAVFCFTAFLCLNFFPVTAQFVSMEYPIKWWHVIASAGTLMAIKATK